MSSADGRPVDNLTDRLRRALQWEADAMEIRYFIARLRRMLDLIEQEANHRADQACGIEGKVGESSVLSGQSLGLMQAHRMLSEIVTELVREYARHARE